MLDVTYYSFKITKRETYLVTPQQWGCVRARIEAFNWPPVAIHSLSLTHTPFFSSSNTQKEKMCVCSSHSRAHTLSVIQACQFLSLLFVLLSLFHAACQASIWAHKPKPYRYRLQKKTTKKPPRGHVTRRSIRYV